MNIGKDYALNSMEDSETSFRFLREKEFLGNSSLLYPLRTVGNHEEVSGEDKIEKEPGWVLHDVANMGIAHALGFVESTNNTSRVGWAKVVSEITKARGPSTDGARMGMPWDFANKEVGLSGWEADVSGLFKLLWPLEYLDCQNVRRKEVTCFVDYVVGW
ncbi:hypothetical protein V6N13_125535 [Hibiscus sabdariffa]